MHPQALINVHNVNMAMSYQLITQHAHPLIAINLVYTKMDRFAITAHQGVLTVQVNLDARLV